MRRSRNERWAIRREYVRAWTVRLLGDERHVSKKMAAALVRLAKSDPSVVVRSQLACTAKRLPASAALPIAAELLKHDEDAGDPQLAAVDLVGHREQGGSPIGRRSSRSSSEPETWKRPIVRDVLVERLARRYMALGDDGGYAACAWLLEHAPDGGRRRTDRRRDGDAVGGTSVRPAAAGARTAAGEAVEQWPTVDRTLVPGDPPRLERRRAETGRSRQRFRHEPDRAA